jgi:hypothetical protein
MIGILTGVLDDLIQVPVLIITNFLNFNSKWHIYTSFLDIDWRIYRWVLDGLLVSRNGDTTS